MRKRWFIPPGTDVVSIDVAWAWTWFALTVSVVMEVNELILPLRYYSQGIFEKCHDDEETTDCWEVSVEVSKR